MRLLAEIQVRGFRGRYTVVKDYVRSQRPRLPLRMERRFEVEPGEQVQVEFATSRRPLARSTPFWWSSPGPESSGSASTFTRTS